MKKLMYDIIGFILKSIARLPLGVLYVFSDIVGFILCHIVRYRRKVIMSNLTACYPEKNRRQLIEIADEFYHRLADYFFETVKLLHISDREMKNRLKWENLDLIDSILADGRSVTIYFAHCFNWEWAPSVTLSLSPEINGKKIKFGQIYRPLRNVWFDSLMLQLRSRFGSVSIQKTRTLRDLLTMHREGFLTVTGFMSDQKPSHNDPVHVISFLRRPTAVITGTAMLACRMSTGVVYWDIIHERRGHYRIINRPIASNASSMTPEEVTDKYLNCLNKQSTATPQTGSGATTVGKIRSLFPITINEYAR